MLLIFLFYSYGIWIPQGKAENGSITKDLEQVPVNNKEEIHALPVGQRGISLTTLDDRPYPDSVEDKTPSSDAVDEKNLQENPSAKEEDEKFVAEKETSSAASPITPPKLANNEEMPSVEEEMDNHASVTDNKQQENSFDEKKSSSLEEERSSISHLINTEEKESQDREEDDISSPFSESFPVTVHKQKTVSEFGIDDNEITGETSPESEDKQGVVADKDMLSDVKEKKNPSASSRAEIPAHSFDERESLAQEEEEEWQTSKDFGEQQVITSDEETDSQEPPREITTSEIQALPVEQSGVSLTTLDDSEITDDTSPGSEDKQGIVSDKELLSDVKEKETPPITSKINESPDYRKLDISMPLNRGAQAAGEEGDTQEKVRKKTESDEVKPAWEIWHTDPTQSIILAVVIALIAAKLGGWIAGVLGFPGVVGKLILGMILGNIYLLTGSDYFDFLKTMPFLMMLSYFGTLVLLLTAGLHTDLRAIFRVGPSSVLVCLGGMVVPAGLGLVVSHFLLPDSSTGSKVLLAIILCSTSTGLLFAILNELKIMNTIEGRVITGATILTEIIVILSFGIVSGIVVKGGVSLLGISISFGIATFLLITAVIIIFKYGERFGNFLTNRLTEGLNIPIIVILSLLMAFMFGSIGLHTVIGAFIAGLFLRNVKLRNSDEDEHRNVESFIRPFYALLVPILFLRVGAQVDLQSFLNLNAILLGLNITGAAILGKLFCGICPIEKGTNRLLIGFGMAMKLEGTLILAGIGRDVGIFNDTVFSSIIMSIVFTSTICPFLMKKLLFKKNNTSSESICIDPEKTELVKAPLNKRMRLKIFGYLI
ncbi:cation:proton antiporter [Candidatus Scalindua japonica]|nr:cation:proton antiporter [Candidatus Scalindua japonica]